MEDDAGDMSDAQEDDEGKDQPSVSETALAKSFFTSHRNASITSQKSLSFNTLPNATLSRQLLLALGSLNLSTPTPIQSECIPLAMMGKDIVASSATGSGKTVAFWVGVLERLLHRDRKNPMTRVVVMTPTRELAVQVHGVGKALARYTDVQFCLCVGTFFSEVPKLEMASARADARACAARWTLLEGSRSGTQTEARRCRLDSGTSDRSRAKHALFHDGRSRGIGP